MRARRVALAYRAHLERVDPQACAAVDELMRTHGQFWAFGSLQVHDDGDAVNTAEAAELASVREETIRRWACTPHPQHPERMLLPRFRRSGRQMTYLVQHVREAVSVMERERANRARSNLTKDL